MKKILVVDDDIDMRAFMVPLVSAWGYMVDAAASAEKALAKMETNCPDIVISDLVMPGGMNGQEFLLHVLAMAPICSVAFILLTGYATVHDAVEAIASGADEVLVKPVDLVKLRALLDYHSTEETERQRRWRLPRQLNHSNTA